MITIESGINNCTIINVHGNINLYTDKALKFISTYTSYKNCSLVIKKSLTSRLHDFFNKNIKLNKQIIISKENCNNSSSAIIYNSLDNFIDNEKNIFCNEVIIILNDKNKRITKALQNQLHETKLTINLNNIEHNINYFKSKLKPKTKIMAMVKASAYGLDNDAEIAKFLQIININYFGVTYIDEGIFLRKRGITIPIMLSITNPRFIKELLEYNIEPCVYSFDILNAITKHINKEYYIHIKIDTGMHRLGFLPKEIDSLIKTIKANNNIIVKSIFSHLASSDETSLESEAFTKKQIQLFNNIASKIEDAIGYKTIKHIANTEAITKYPNAHLDMVRIGKGLYGLHSYRDSTKAIAGLSTTIVQIKNIDKNETIGYNRTKTLTKDTKVAIIKIGYADGYSYDIYKNAYVIINNQKAKILGKVCMDLCMVDVTNIDCNQGDTAIIFNETNLAVEKIANWKNTSAYEVITSLSKRLKRIYAYS